MKPSNDNDSGRSNHHLHNWLGFSLSPHIKMEAAAAAAATPHSLDHHHHYYNPQPQVSPVPTPFCFSPPHPYNTQYTPAFCYGAGENSAFHSSSLPMMPLKSDGSLCIMEALTRSPQQQGSFLFFFFLFIQFSLSFSMSRFFSFMLWCYYTNKSHLGFFRDFAKFLFP